MTRFADAAERLAGAAGLLLGWKPETFWSATPRDLAIALGPLRPQGGGVADAGDIARLMEMYPDG